jgi:hypothetical protein
MEENVKVAQEELASLNEGTPLSLDDVCLGLEGFGIEDFEEILTLTTGGKSMRIRLSNICTDDEMVALMAVEGQKGQAWTQRVKCEILSRAISWISLGKLVGDKWVYSPGISIRTLQAAERIATDPKDGQQKDIQVVLRNLITGWGEELVQILWKVFMVHAQRIEDRLTSEFPESATMTEIERRFTAQALKEIEDQTKNQIRETVAEIFKEGEDAEETPAPAPAAEVKPTS